MIACRASACALALAVGAATVVAQESKPSQPVRASATIAQVAWIAGSWSGGDGATTIEERWTEPAGGAMLAMSRTLRGNRMVEFEFLRIVERDGVLVYVAQPGGRPPTDFTSTKIDADSVTFENQAHDYPQMIRYAKRADGGLDATISAAGGARAKTYSFRRQ